ncbi:MAG: hypothetical protein ACHQ53_13455, partial [Polyangiales bacterium]
MHPRYLQSSNRVAVARWLAFALALGFGCSSSRSGPGGANGQLGDGGNPFANVSTSKNGALKGKADGGGSDGAASGLVQLTKTCGASQFGATPAQVNVLLVIDKSGSMMEMPKGFDTDKWSAMKMSLASSLQAVEDKMWLGLELFPHAHCELPSGSDMDVDIQAGATALPLVTMALDAAMAEGGTPTAA